VRPIRVKPEIGKTTVGGWQILKDEKDDHLFVLCSHLVGFVENMCRCIGKSADFGLIDKLGFIHDHLSFEAALLLQ
jgi:hypothetical protein